MPHSWKEFPHSLSLNDSYRHKGQREGPFNWKLKRRNPLLIGMPTPWPTKATLVVSWLSLWHNLSNLLTAKGSKEFYSLPLIRIPFSIFPTNQQIFVFPSSNLWPNEGPQAHVPSPMGPSQTKGKWQTKTRRKRRQTDADTSWRYQIQIQIETENENEIQIRIRIRFEDRSIFITSQAVGSVERRGEVITEVGGCR